MIVWVILRLLHMFCIVSFVMWNFYGLLKFCGFVGFLYLVVFDGIWIITCVFGKGPIHGMKV